jgi:protein-disulfide isomerase
MAPPDRVSRRRLALSRYSGFPIVIAAVIIGASIVSGSFLIRSSLEHNAQELAEMKTALGELEIAAPARAPAARPEARARPDPNRRHSIDIEGAPARGGEDAKVVIVEFSDFQCPFCGRAWPTLRRIEDEYGDQVRIVFKHLPLRMHTRAPAAHAAAEAAHRQGNFWEMHDHIIANQSALDPEKFTEYAKEIGLDLERFEKDVASAEVKKKVDADAAEAARLGVTGTPAFFINGRFLSGARPFESFKEMIDREAGDT